jgi:transposase
MKNETTNTCGIDVSKDTLDCCYGTEDGREVHLKVSNDEKGFRQLYKECGRRKYVMETTGPYYLRLALWLKEKQCSVCVENALVIKRFIQMNQERSKNDKKDARWIFHYSQQRELKEWRVPAREQVECQQLLRGIESYNRQRTMMLNQLHSIETLPWQSVEMMRSIKAMVRKIESEIDKLQQLLEEKLKTWAPNQSENLQSIPGLGKRAAAMLIVFTEAFEKVENYRQLICLAGLSPREFTSGSSVRGKTRICKMGGGHLRSILYMCSMSAIKNNKACKALYERLRAKGKNGKVALIAVCNKLLKQAFAIAKSGRKYDENYLSVLV